MRLPLLANPSFALVALALVACSEPEPAPIPAAPVGEQPVAQSGGRTPGPGPVAVPGGAGPERRSGDPKLSPNVPAMKPPVMPNSGDAIPGPLRGEPVKIQFEPGDSTIEITVSAEGFGPEAELQIIEMVKGDFGTIRPRVVHIEPLKGRKTLEITAPAELPGKFYALVMEGELPNSTFSGAEQALSLSGKDLTVKVSQGEQGTWMAQLPMGPPPENTLSDEAIPPENLSDGEPPPETE